MIRHIYLDESDYCSRIAYGALVSDIEVVSSTIEKALKALKSDPDRLQASTKKYDDMTLERGYFHASEDSKNAHSHLCNAINSDISGEFSASFITPVDGEEKNSVYYLLAKLSSLKAFNSGNHLKFIFENRNGLSIPSLEKWYKTYENELLMSAYTLPYVPTYFPSVSFDIADKKNPGLQCTDFILWVAQRYANDSNDVWIDRLKVKARSEITGIESAINLTLRENLHESRAFYSIADYPVNSNINTDLQFKFFLQAERIVHHYSRTASASNMAHLHAEIINVANKRNNAEEKSHIVELAAVYLKLFDMVPLIYEQTSQDDKQLLLLSRKYFASILNDQLVDGMRLRTILFRMWIDIVKKRPNLLEF